MATTRTDSDLIADSLSDPASFAEIFERHYDSVSVFLCRRVDGSLADELAAQTFLLAFKSRTGFDTQRDSSRPWLLGIALNLIRHEARSNGRRFRAYARLDRLTEPDFSSDAIERADAEVRIGQLAAALAQLTADERDALTLCVWEDLTYAEVAEVLEIPIGTVRSRISRARSRMTELLEELSPQTTGVNADGF